MQHRSKVGRLPIFRATFSDHFPTLHTRNLLRIIQRSSACSCIHGFAFFLSNSCILRACRSSSTLLVMPSPATKVLGPTSMPGSSLSCVFLFHIQFIETYLPRGPAGPSFRPSWTPGPEPCRRLDRRPSYQGHFRRQHRKGYVSHSAVPAETVNLMYTFIRPRNSHSWSRKGNVSPCPSSGARKWSPLLHSVLPEHWSKREAW